jgi:hypothetical protein
MSACYSCNRNLWVEELLDSMVTDIEWRLPCVRDAHNATSTSISDEG